jgi:hypothetical protein
LTTTSGYQFFKLLNVAVFTIAGSMGLVFLRQGLRASVDAENPEGAAHVIHHAFVGSQLAG